jgi:hypothetical protein
MLNIRKIEKEIVKSSGEIVAVFKHIKYDRYTIVYMGAIDKIKEKYKDISFINYNNMSIGLLGYLKVLAILDIYLVYSKHFEIHKVSLVKCIECGEDAEYKVKVYGEVEQYFCTECAKNLHIL